MNLKLTFPRRHRRPALGGELNAVGLSLAPHPRQRFMTANVIAFKFMTTWLQIAGWIVVA
jgi:hypothetical protein